MRIVLSPVFGSGTLLVKLLVCIGPFAIYLISILVCTENHVSLHSANMSSDPVPPFALDPVYHAHS